MNGDKEYIRKLGNNMTLTVGFLPPELFFSIRIISSLQS